jgi:hypothetical protein
MWALLLKFYDRIYYGKIYFSLQHTVIIIYNPAIAIYTLSLFAKAKLARIVPTFITIVKILSYRPLFNPSNILNDE